MSSRSKQQDFYQCIRKRAERAIDSIVTAEMRAGNRDTAETLAKRRESIAMQIADDLSETYRMMEVADIFEWKMRKVDRR